MDCMLTLPALLSLVSALASLFLCAYVYGQRRRSAANRAFVLFSLLVAVTTLAEALILLTGSLESGKVLVRISGAAFFLFGFAFLEFVRALTDHRRTVFYWVCLVAAVVACVLSAVKSPIGLVMDPQSGAILFVPEISFAYLFLAAGQSPGVYAVLLLIAAARKGGDGASQGSVRLLLMGTLLSIVYATVVLVGLPAMGLSGAVQYSCRRFSYKPCSCTVRFVATT